MRSIWTSLALVSLALASFGVAGGSESQLVLRAGADARSIVPDQDADGAPDLERIYLGGFGLGPYRVFDPTMNRSRTSVRRIAPPRA